MKLAIFWHLHLLQTWRVKPTSSRSRSVHTTSMKTIKFLRSPASLVKVTVCRSLSLLSMEVMMTMETTTMVPSRLVLRWRLVVAVRCKDPRELRRRHVRHRWRGLDT
uniref:Uncharacterized protein n=1 Tax=Brassica oleracea TaxID=3712 RepID=A0A3P6DHK6_BRAOL|nr:unnamed protein product [Brassica oleracea]